MKLFFYGDIAQRAYYLNKTHSLTYSRSGVQKVMEYYCVNNDKNNVIFPPAEDCLEYDHDKRFNLCVYNAVAHYEKSIEILTHEIDSAKRHLVYRLEDEILHITSSKAYEIKLDDNDTNDFNIVVAWTKKSNYYKLPPKADYYLWVVEDELPDSDFLKSHDGKKIILVRSDILRKCGARISRSLSWERTANETVWQCTQNALLREKLMFSDLVFIPFGLEGMVLLDNITKNDNNDWVNHLWFHSSLMEGDMRTFHPGIVPEAFEALVYNLLNDIQTSLLRNMPLVDIVKSRLDNHLLESYKIHLCGYDAYANKVIHLNYDHSTSQQSMNGQLKIPDLSFKFKRVNIPNHNREWRMIYDTAKQAPRASDLKDILFEVARYGPERSIVCPILKIGNLITVDRSEIEAYSNIRNLLREYISNPNQRKPLSLAVFGQPGSGKSFGVKEIVKTLLPEGAKPLEYNLSQNGRANLSDLFVPFHNIQDQTLTGNIPLVFFDEFDSDNLEWLRYFLMPMEDGSYVENGTIHPLGKCIFVFAGGTNSSFEQLEQKCNDEKYNDKKLADFLSRLKGYVNILGVNALSNSSYDTVHLFRRAIILSSMIKQMKISLSDDVLNALIFTKNYKHGVRSMRAIIEMSLHSSKNTLDISDLPPEEQLRLHVDPLNFLTFLEDRIHFDEMRGRVARRLLNDDKERSWDSCDYETQKQYWDEADEIINIIWNVYDLRVRLCGDTHKVPEEDTEIVINPTTIYAEINKYAETLHNYLCRQNQTNTEKYKCHDVSWDKLGSDDLEWLNGKVRRVFSPFNDIDANCTSYYLSKKSIYA